MTKYAATTTVTPDKTQREIKAIIEKYDGDDVVMGESRAEQKVLVECRVRGRRLRFLLPLLSSYDTQFARTPTGRASTQSARQRAWEQDVRSRWRALYLIIKATLEAVESGIITAEVGFMPYLVLPNGSTVAEHVLPKVTEAIESGDVPHSFLAIEGAR